MTYSGSTVRTAAIIAWAATWPPKTRWRSVSDCLPRNRLRSIASRSSSSVRSWVTTGTAPLLAVGPAEVPAFGPAEAPAVGPDATGPGSGRTDSGATTSGLVVLGTVQAGQELLELLPDLLAGRQRLV